MKNFKSTNIKWHLKWFNAREERVSAFIPSGCFTSPISSIWSTFTLFSTKIRRLIGRWACLFVQKIFSLSEWISSSYVFIVSCIFWGIVRRCRINIYIGVSSKNEWGCIPSRKTCNGSLIEFCKIYSKVYERREETSVVSAHRIEASKDKLPVSLQPIELVSSPPLLSLLRPLLRFFTLSCSS